MAISNYVIPDDPYCGWFFVRVDGGRMNHVNINAFYSLGSTFRTLAEIGNLNASRM